MNRVLSETKMRTAYCRKERQKQYDAGGFFIRKQSVSESLQLERIPRFYFYIAESDMFSSEDSRRKFSLRKSRKMMFSEGELAFGLLFFQVILLQ